MSRIAELRQPVHSFGVLTNDEFSEAIGAPGVPGDDALIGFIC